jgi:beta-lactamase superfamily II metal-dependent hydrolase
LVKLVKRASSPRSVEIRAFQVGFGDCFLVSFIYASGPRHVLIDFGSTGLPKGAAKPSVHMPAVAREIQRICGASGLTAVVATHRHADHISGFGTDRETGKSGEIIKSLRPKVVLQPWTEDPAAQQNATKATRDSNRTPRSFTAALADMQVIAKEIAAIARSPQEALGPDLARQLSFIGEDNVSNLSAVKNLIEMGNAKGSTAVWAHHGSDAGLGPHLPGVEVTVLGPPNLVQSQKVRRMRQNDPDQFWHLLAGTPRADGVGHAARDGARPQPAARWFRDRLDHLRGEQLLEIVTALDDQMNNTSLILLFEVNGKKLLFPGDAQIENWSYALVDAPDAAATRARLAEVDFYKVGHHGSLNATPKKLLWEAFKKRTTARKKKLKTALSTMPGKHGAGDRHTEVPRRPLVEALAHETDLKSTNDLPLAPGSPLYQLVVVGL